MKKNLNRRDFLKTLSASALGASVPLLSPNSAHGFGFGKVFNRRTGDYWMPTNISTTGAPAARYAQASCWIGDRLFVWGGFDLTNVVNTGGLYNPFTDTWTATSTGANCPSARYLPFCAWTGTEVVVWAGFDGGGMLGNGAKYNPSTNTWTTMGGTPPSTRGNTCFHWNGTYITVYGGEDPSGNALSGGKRYDPVGNTWLTMSTTGAPGLRNLFASALVSPTQLVVWGGTDDITFLDTGAVYNPNANSWTAMTTSGAPAGKFIALSGATDSKFMVWGGFDGASWVNSGGLYDPNTNTWSSVTTTGAPTGAARFRTQLVWGGGRMHLWGGSVPGTNYTSPVNTGGSYDPVANSWRTYTTTGGLSARSSHNTVWTGRELLIYGGVNDNTTAVFSDGKLFKPTL